MNPRNSDPTRELVPFDLGNGSSSAFHPEPVAAIMLAAGLGGLAWIGWRPRRRRERSLARGVAGFIALALAALTTAAPGVASAKEPAVLRFSVDVAEDFNRFVPTKVNPSDSEPKRGSFFLTEGHLFPAGTIEGDGSSFDPSSPGSIGTWVCRGTHLADASAILSGAAPIWVATTQNYLMPDDGRSLATEGREGSNPIARSVIGGTGPFAAYVGEQRQELLGFNATGGVNLRVTFILKRVGK